MAGFDHLTSQCDEVLMLIFFSLDGKSVLRLAQTCRKLYQICTYDQQLWSQMCLLDFAIGLVSPHPFTCFRHLYKCIYQSREILRFYLSDEYQDYGNNRYGVFPSWLWTWVVFNTNPPLLPEWIRNYHEPFLRYKMSEISLGKTLRVWSLKSSDLPEHIVTRMEYGTSYYRWRDIQVAAMRVHGGPKGLEKFMLKRCWRSRGYVERAFERIQNGTFMQSNRSKCTDSSAPFGEGSHSMQTSQMTAQITQASHNAAGQGSNGNSGSVAHASRQVAHASGQLANASGEVAHASGLVAHASRQVAHASGRLANASGEVAHASGVVAHASRQVAHGSRQPAHVSRLAAVIVLDSSRTAHVSGQSSYGTRRVAHASEEVAHASRQPEHGLSENAHGSAEMGESSRERARSVQYVFSSSSNSSMESE